MLLRTIFVLALFTIVAETIAHGAAALAAQALHQRALQASRVALVTGIQTAQSAVAQTIAVNPSATTFPLPSPVATCVYADAAGCTMNVQTTFDSPSPAPSATACPQTDCAILVQANSAIGEGRASVLVTTTVSAASGAPLATRRAVAAFRTFDVAPYATLVGGVDASVDALMNGGAADDAGSASSLITVQYAPSGGGSPVSGNVWQSEREASATAAPAWEH